MKKVIFSLLLSVMFSSYGLTLFENMSDKDYRRAKLSVLQFLMENCIFDFKGAALLNHGACVIFRNEYYEDIQRFNPDAFISEDLQKLSDEDKKVLENYIEEKLNSYN